MATSSQQGHIEAMCITEYSFWSVVKAHFSMRHPLKPLSSSVKGIVIEAATHSIAGNMLEGIKWSGNLVAHTLPSQISTNPPFSATLESADCVSISPFSKCSPVRCDYSDCVASLIEGVSSQISAIRTHTTPVIEGFYRIFNPQTPKFMEGSPLSGAIVLKEFKILRNVPHHPGINLFRGV